MTKAPTPDFSTQSLAQGLETAMALREFGQRFINLAAEIEYHCGHPEDLKSVGKVAVLLEGLDWEGASDLYQFHLKVLRQVRLVQELLSLFKGA